MTDRELIMCRLSDAIKESGITAKELAKATGISYYTIRNYINQKNMPSLKKLIIITKVLNVNVESICDNLVTK